MTLNRLLFHQPINNQKGMVLVWTAVFLVVALGLAALSVDLAYAYVISNELKSVADAGALTAASSYLSEFRKSLEESMSGSDQSIDFDAIMAEVRRQVEAMVRRSRVLSLGVFPNVKVEFGTYDNGSGFAPSSDPTKITAFRVTLNRGENKPLTFHFAQILGVSTFQMERNSISQLAPRYFLLLLDTSGSMHSVTYDAEGLGSGDQPFEPERSFITKYYGFDVDPTTDAENNEIWFSALAPVLNNPFTPTTNTRFPEPLQTVLAASLDFLKRLTTQINVGDRAAVIYFSDNAVTKIPLTNVEEDLVNSQFETLLSNTTLYSNLQPNTWTDGIKTVNYFKLPPDLANTYDDLKKQFLGTAIAAPIGNTNIGGVIDAAQTAVASDLGSQGKTAIVNMILLTDGRPTCDAAGCYGSGGTSGQLESARNYAFQRATDAIKKGILIYPISYGICGDTVDCTLLHEIGSLSGLKQDFHIDSGAADTAAEIKEGLDKVFAEIATLIPFVLVE